MNKIKNTYSAPEADLLVVRFEQNIMSVQAQNMPTFTMDEEEEW